MPTHLFDRIVYTVSMVKLIEEGHLSKMVTKDPHSAMSVDGAGTQGGDFKRSDLSSKNDRSELTERICNELLNYTGDYKKWLLFVIDIKHACHVQDTLEGLGINTVVIHSKLTPEQKEANKKKFVHGNAQVAINVDILTTGFDYPRIDLIGLLRPTKSPVLHVQMIGRGLRVHPEKDHCIVLDFAHNLERLGPINEIKINKKRKKKGGPPIVKTCPECRTIHYPSVRICTFCGYEFKFREHLKPTASTKEVVAKPKKENWYPVTAVTYQEHCTKKGKLVMLVGYRCGLRTFFEYKVFNPGSRVGYNTAQWWNYRSIDLKVGVPTSVAQAVIYAQSGALRSPKGILVDESKSVPDIKKYIF